MNLLQSTWNQLKTWRHVNIGPVSVMYRFRRRVQVSRNRGACSPMHASPATAAGRSRPHGALTSQDGSVRSHEPRMTSPSDIAVIFGVGPGFGFALARRLVQAGMHVALISRQSSHLDDLASSLNAAAGEERARVYSCDVCDESGVRAVLARLAREIGVPTLVVYSVQNSVPGRAIEISTDAFEDCWRSNCLGGFIVARECARIMQPQRRGSILLIGSTSGLFGREGHLSLAVGKFGLRALSQVMARELWRDGLHVAHIVIDAGILEPGKEDTATMSDPSEIAEVVYSVHQQPRSAWTSEIDVRPWNETFWEHC
jgi:NAD(P)-dependent dehydrogenase (short-subunit alcohol dehydrogenase family)